MKVLLLASLAMLPGFLTVGNPPPKGKAHVYIAYRVIPYFGEASAARGMMVLDVEDGEGRIAVVGIPPELIEQIVSFSKKKPVSYEP